MNSANGRKRRWFIYRDDEKKEVASVNDVIDFSTIIVKLKEYVEKEYVDLADEEELTAAIQAVLPGDERWPEQYCVDILIKAAEKYNRTYRKQELYKNNNSQLHNAQIWIIENLRVIKEYYRCDNALLQPNAIIVCGNDIVESVKKDIYHMLMDAVQMTKSDGALIHVLKMEGSLYVFYPVGEVYGQSYEYIESVKESFGELKKKYNTLGIHGLVYYYETISYATSGFFFSCDPEEKDLRYTFDWQKCKQCGKVFTEDVFYNSRQWDDGEGTLGCLCSPLCMLEYALNNGIDYGGFKVMPNRQINEKYRELLDTEEWEECSRDIIWKEFIERFEDCIKDCVESRERLMNINNLKDINRERWNDFLREAKKRGIDVIV